MKKVIKVDPFSPISRDFNTVVNSFFGNSLNDFVGRDHSLYSPAVNVIEDQDKYTLEVAAPGLSKENFTISLENQKLIISAEHSEDHSEETKKYNRREFNYSQFSRSFTMPKGTLDEHISAQYTNGVLSITIQKVQDETKIKKLIEIN